MGNIAGTQATSWMEQNQDFLRGTTGGSIEIQIRMQWMICSFPSSQPVK